MTKPDLKLRFKIYLKSLTKSILYKIESLENLEQLYKYKCGVFSSVFKRVNKLSLTDKVVIMDLVSNFTDDINAEIDAKEFEFFLRNDIDEEVEEDEMVFQEIYFGCENHKCFLLRE